MAKEIKRKCPQCGQVKLFRSDQKTCGCKPPSLEPVEVSEITNDGWKISLPHTRIHTLDELIKQFNIDLSIWEVERFVANKWEMGYIQNISELRTKVSDKTESITTDKQSSYQELYQVKAFLKKKHNVVFAKKEIEELKKLGKDGAKVPYKIKKKPGSTGYMLEVNIIDHHFGKMAWSVETGHPNYDIHIAVDLFWRAFDAIMERTKSFEFEEIYFIVGNDLFNSDDVQGRTTGGTFVTTDARFYKIFSIVRTLTIEAIERLRAKTEKVVVIMVSGNHDHLSVWHLGDSLECYFHKYSDVVIDNTPRYYKYFQFGKVMLMFTHGDKGKMDKYPLMMATEQPKMFGETKYREVHVGHRHTKEVQEHNGVRVRRLSALCPPDVWHAENGFVGNIRQTEAFVWNRDEGLVSTVIFTDSDENIPKATEPPTA